MKYAVMDFETTGPLQQDEIIQIGLVVVEQDQIIDKYNTFVKPKASIPESVTQLTGITDDMVKDAPSIEDAIADMLPYLEQSIFVAHHAAFDLGFLQRALDQCGYSPFSGLVLDTMDLLRFLYPDLPSLQLSMVSSALGVPHLEPHKADSDAEATALIFIQCIQKLNQLPYLTVQRLSYLFDEPAAQLSDLKWWIDQLLFLKETQGDLEESTLSYRQFALNVEDWADEMPESTAEPIEETFEAFYEQMRDNLKQKFAKYEEREAQTEMIRQVMEAFAEEKHLIVEAGTGTGKSLGYLIPSIYYSLKNQEKVAISTHTINLQEQIKQRDLPLLHEISPHPFHAAVLKGRSHYLCLRKFEQKINLKDYDANREQVLLAAQMIVWLGETKIGDEEEIHLGQRGADFWQSVASDTDSCLNRSCPWFRKCFYHRARNDAQKADVVITNHSLLFTDQKADHRILPAYQSLIIDEAHQFDETAGKHLGIQINYFSLSHALNWLYKDAYQGKLITLKSLLENNGHEKSETWVDLIEQSIQRIEKIKEHWEEFHHMLYQHWVSPQETAAAQETGQIVVRFKPSEPPKEWELLRTIEDNIHADSGELIKSLQRLMEELKEEAGDFELQSLITDLNGSYKDIVRCRDDLRFFVKMKNTNDVYWLEANVQYRHKSIQLYTVPVDVSMMLKEMFFDAKDSIVMTSATLSVNQNFEYVKEQVGLSGFAEKNKLQTVQLPSPFNYRKNVLVCIPRDFPKLKGIAGEKEFALELIQSLSEVAQVTDGRMLVLFTSYRMLKMVHGGLKEKLQGTGIQVLGQGVDSNNRSKLTKWFTDSPNCVLLGTSSFWEGVDIPGDDLSCLCIVRLPFQPPNHPVAEAKSDFLKQQNKNPFMHYSVPQAVIRFKQGFGRLIRTSSDRGVVIIYDTRVIDTYYGKHFLYSLPGPKIEHMSKQQMIHRVKEWFDEEKEVQPDVMKEGR
ncbi:ATP-dependent DNA helicase DinG [Marinicrinis lubricantis]|uniref:3'-5' exonuclease DinG n=1 Tax=Marinicrinis lubricantis TaxID=2086470 RepID=A0ABW1ILZ2_9BACL